MRNLFIDPRGNYPRYKGDLLLEHPNWKETDDLPDGWQAVEEITAPVMQGYFKVIELPPRLENGVYYQSWEIIEQTEEEKAAYDEQLAKRPT